MNAQATAVDQEWNSLSEQHTDFVLSEQDLLELADDEDDESFLSLSAHDTDFLDEDELEMADAA